MARDRYDDEYDDRPPRRRDRDDDYDDDDGYDDRPRGPRPPNYLAPSILVTLCCCLPGGIVAIVFAAQVNNKWDEGDRAGARQASASAKMWCWLSAGVGLVLGVISGVVQVLAIQQQQGFR